MFFHRYSMKAFQRGEAWSKKFRSFGAFRNSSSSRYGRKFATFVGFSATCGVAPFFGLPLNDSASPVQLLQQSTGSERATASRNLPPFTRSWVDTRRKREEIEIAVICALPLEANAVAELFDTPLREADYGKARGDKNVYSLGVIGRHKVVIAHMPGMGKGNAASVAASCRASFPNIKLGLVVGICGGVPGKDGTNAIFLGDVVISDAVIQIDFGRQYPDGFERKTDVMDILGRPDPEIRARLAKLKSIRNHTMLQDDIHKTLQTLAANAYTTAQYPGEIEDRLFPSAYRHKHQDPSSCLICANCHRDADPVCREAEQSTCEKLGCDAAKAKPRTRTGTLPSKPIVHFGRIASADMVMKSGQHRDQIARRENVIAFEMEGAGVWDNIPCVVIKGVCDYADSHKSKKWQSYAATTAACCMKAFLDSWTPSDPNEPAIRNAGPWFFVPYRRNPNFVQRPRFFEQVRKNFGHFRDTPKVSPYPKVVLCGLGGTGKSEIALDYAHWLHKEFPDLSIFWVHANNADLLRKSYLDIAKTCQIPGYDKFSEDENAKLGTEPKVDVLALVRDWLETQESWFIIFDNANNIDLFSRSFYENQIASKQGMQQGDLDQYIPDHPNGSILFTTQSKRLARELTTDDCIIEIPEKMEEKEALDLFQKKVRNARIPTNQISTLCAKLAYLPLALSQAASFIVQNSTTVEVYLKLVEKKLGELLKKPIPAEGRSYETERAVATTFRITLDHMQRHDPLASELFSVMCCFESRDIPQKFLSQYIKQHGYRNKVSGASRKLQLVESLGTIQAYSFATSSTGETLDMHPLVQIVGRDWLRENEVASEYVGRALSIIEDAFPDASHENRTVCLSFLPQALATLEFSEEFPKLSEEHKLKKASLLHLAAGFFLNEGIPDQAQSFLRKALKIREEFLSLTHTDTLRSKANLALSIHYLGTSEEAERALQEVLNVKESLGASNDDDTLKWKFYLAEFYKAREKFAEAETLLKEVIEAHQNVKGPDHQETVRGKIELVALYIYQDRLSDAEELAKEMVIKSRDCFGENHSETISCELYLAYVYRRLMQLNEAEELQINALRKCVTFWGADDRITLVCKNELRKTYCERKPSHEAEKLVAEIVRRELGF